MEPVRDGEPDREQHRDHELGIHGRTIRSAVTRVPSVPEAHVREEPVQPPRQPPGGPAGEAQQDRHQHQPHEQRVEQHRNAEDDPISFGGTGPDRRT